MKTRNLYLWSYRWTVARGWNWAREREVSAATSLQWQDVFKKDAPSVLFIVRATRPQSKDRGIFSSIIR